MNTDWGLMVVTFLFALMVGWFSGAMMASLDWKWKAIETGHAEYYLDDKHQRQFRWKDHGK